jgi:LysM repeat protein
VVYLRRIAAPLAVVAAIVGGLAGQVVASAGSYTIGDGDTLSVIAANNDTSVDTLVALNGIADPDLIFPGDVLILPDSNASASDIVSTDDESADERSTGDPSAQSSDEVTDDDGTDQDAPSEWVDPPFVDQETIVSLLVQAADMYGWDPSLILAQAWQESRWRQDGVSNAGAIGVMQVLPDTAAGVGDWYLGREVDPWNNVWDNIESGVAYLTVLYDETGSVEDALAAYYQGLGSLERDGMYDDTREYIDLIFGFQRMIQDGDFRALQ